MKKHIPLAALFALCAIALPALAQPPAPGTRGAPAPPAPGAPAAPNAPTPPKRDPVTFLGVVAVPASPALVEQLGLAPGFGLVVESVVPDSPADKAGIKRFDLLTSFGDQRLASAAQLSALVRASNDGADVVLTGLRKGQEMKVTAKLVKRAGPDNERGFGRYIRDMMKQSGLPPGWDFNVGPDGANGKRITIRRPGDGGDRTTTVDMNRASIIIRDDKGEIEVSGEPGKRVFTARKPDGTVIFSGPINNDDERKKVPSELLEKLNKIERDRNASVRHDRERERERGRGHDEDGDDDNAFDFDMDFGGDFVPPVMPLPPIPPVPPVGYPSDPVT